MAYLTLEFVSLIYIEPVSILFVWLSYLWKYSELLPVASKPGLKIIIIKLPLVTAAEGCLVLNVAEFSFIKLL